MIVYNDTVIELTAEERATARDFFFGSKAGRYFLQALTMMQPKIVKTGSADDKIMSAGAHAGYEEACENINFLCNPPQKKESGESGRPGYPDLDNDSNWEQSKDGGQQPKSQL